jgi:hypothetical protein
MKYAGPQHPRSLNRNRLIAVLTVRRPWWR